MKTIVLAAALAALVASPALAQDPVPRPGKTSKAKTSKAQASDQPGFAWRGYGSGHDSPYRAFGAVNPSEGLDGRARETALRECAETSRKFAESTWGHMQMHQWRTCMMARGQPE